MRSAENADIDNINNPFMPFTTLTFLSRRAVVVSNLQLCVTPFLFPV